MKRKWSIGLNIVLFAICICSLAFGVYSAQIAKVNVAGSLKFTAHNCKVRLSASIYGHATSPNTKPILEANAVTLATNQVIDGTTGALSLGNVYFSDLGPELTKQNDITIVLTIENQSTHFPVLIEDTASEQTYGKYEVICSNPLHVLYTDEANKTTTLTYTLRAIPNEDGNYTNITTPVSVSIGMKFSKLNTEISSNGYTFGSDGTSITGVPKRTTSDTIIIPSTFTDKAGTYTTICDGSSIANIETYKKVIILKEIETVEDSAFTNCDNLTTIALPSTLKYIGESAFESCINLKSVNIPSGVSFLCPYTFQGCTSLTSIIIPNSVTRIDNCTFYECTSLTDVNIPNGVTSIGAGAFAGCTSLTSITIPNGVTIIGAEAFQGCTSLTSINIPSSVTNIYSRAFAGCSGLSSITVHPNNTRYKSEGNAILSKDGTELYVGCKNTIIPDGVTYIEYDAFRGCTSLTSIIIPEGVTSIGSGAFGGCNNLNSITLPFAGDGSSNTHFGYIFGAASHLENSTYVPTSLKTVVITNTTNIGEYAFYKCTDLTNITIQEGVTSIGIFAFYHCTSLTSITIPEGVTSIGNSAFYGCTSLTSITIPEGVISIDNFAFEACTSLTSITIPASVKKIGKNAFIGCTQLTSADFKTTSGWWYSSSSTATSGTPISATGLASQTTAAIYLRSNYVNYYWGRT